MICTSLVNKARFKKLETDYKIIANADLIWKSTSCDIYSKDCVWWQCESCWPKSIEKPVPIQRCKCHHCIFPMGNCSGWKKCKKKNYQTAKKVMKTGSVAEVIIHLQDLLACFSIHNHTNINQLHNFKQAKKNLKKMSW